MAGGDDIKEANRLSIAENVRNARFDRRLTQTEVARRCGVTPAAISGLEHGEFNPSTPLLVKLAKALDVPIEDLLEEDVITFDNEAVRAAITGAKAGKLTTKEAAQAIADSVRGGPADALEDALELLLEHAERGRSEDRAGAK